MISLKQLFEILNHFYPNFIFILINISSPSKLCSVIVFKPIFPETFITYSLLLHPSFQLIVITIRI